MATPHTDLSVDEIKLSDPFFWARTDREGAFAKLRAERPVSFHEEMEYPGLPLGPGFWAITRYADVWTVSRNPQRFISGQGSNIGDLPIDLAEFFGSMINMDAPRHTKLRLIVNRGFTPRRVGNVEHTVREKARKIIAAVAERGECDFVNDIAAALPLEIICDMMGIPPSDYRRVFELTNTILGVGDPEYASTIEQLMAAGMELAQYAQRLGEERLVTPTEDITSAMMHAEVEGQRLSPQEFGSFFILLVVAGNETTRNAISHGMKALTDFPAERAKWQHDFARVTPTAVEEIVRWASPVIHFRRTATEDTELSGQAIKAGEKVVMWYNSANRDGEQFADPYRFDVTRDPNEHVGFGAGGPHFCLGANLARREIAVMFEELFQHLPDIEISGPPDMLLSAFIHGIKRMPCRFTPTKLSLA
ncbi:MAG: cytochrome P450 [Deltaproteobacteria bacterium]|nr:cytochrome P450 [Deltaproteobacteria bacterium]MBI3390847.1 cytochrome P450 [Deltaproteobacteria bacterium]